jgi:hypothetical protein
MRTVTLALALLAGLLVAARSSVAGSCYETQNLGGGTSVHCDGGLTGQRSQTLGGGTVTQWNDGTSVHTNEMLGGGTRHDVTRPAPVTRPGALPQVEMTVPHFPHFGGSDKDE